MIVFETFVSQLSLTSFIIIYQNTLPLLRALILVSSMNPVLGAKKLGTTLLMTIIKL